MYHQCCRDNNCKGLKQGIKGYHECCRTNNCGLKNKQKKNKIIGKVEPDNIIDMVTTKPIKLTIPKKENFDNVFNIIDDHRKYFKSSRKELYKTDVQQTKANKLINAVIAYDFYETPAIYAELIYKSIPKIIKTEPYNVLEPAAGFGQLMYPFIKDKNASITMIELNPHFYDILKNFKSSKIDVINQDFFDFVPSKKFDLIVMNPPFSCGSNKVCYLDFILRSVELLNHGNYEKYIYVICPKTNFKHLYENIYELRLTKAYVNKILMKYPHYQKYISDYGNGPILDHIGQIRFISDVTGFRKINKNGILSEMKMTVGLYEIICY